MRHERATRPALLFPLLLSLAAALPLLVAIPACSDTLAQADEPEWPLELDAGDARIVLYQPEPDALQNDELTARAAVSVLRPGDSEPVFGAVWLQARVATDRDARTVTVLDVKVTKASFPHSAPEQESELTGLVEGEIAKLHHTFSLDCLEATLDQAQERRSADGIGTAPPKILFASTPTVLVTIDGQPQLQKIQGTDVMRVVNTPFVILFDPADKSYHLRQDRRWARATEIEGPWQDEAEPPAAVAAALPPPQIPEEAARPAPRGDAQVLVVTEPAELIATDGEPKWTPLPGNDLLFLANSDSDVFLDVASQQHYVLLSGRWYTSRSLEQGPWTWVAADALPQAFARIPPGSEHGDVRAFVAGTDEAQDAVLDASVPQTSAIARDGPPCQVSYDGEPQFADIEGTSLRYAVNTAESVIACEGRFYCCQEGVWYVADGATGPWSVCTAVPAAIDTIPPSCPVYPVTYVHVYDATPEVVYVGYLPGYTGCYVYGPTIVYGTGWWYPGWYGSVYYPHPCTWGFGAYYNAWGCDWLCGPSFGWGVSPWWFGCGYGWGYPGWWGPGGLHCNHFDLHGHTVHPHAPPPVTGVQGARLRAIQTHAGHHDIYKRAENVARNAPLAAGAGAPGRTKTGTRAGNLVPNDVFVDREGNVLRRTQTGWEDRHPEGWRPSERVTPSAPRTTPVPSAPPAGREPARPITPPGVSPTSPGLPPVVSPPRAVPRPVPAPPPAPPRGEPATPPRVQPVTPPPRVQSISPSAPPRDDFERMNRSREQGSSRASGFRERAGGASVPVPRPAPPPRPRS